MQETYKTVSFGMYKSVQVHLRLLVIIVTCYKQPIPEEVEFTTAVVKYASKICVNMRCSESVSIVLVLFFDPKVPQGQV